MWTQQAWQRRSRTRGEGRIDDGIGGGATELEGAPGSDPRLARDHALPERADPRALARPGDVDGREGAPRTSRLPALSHPRGPRRRPRPGADHDTAVIGHEGTARSEEHP